MGSTQDLLALVAETVQELAGLPQAEGPSPQKVRTRAERHGRPTKLGNWSFASAVRSRSAGVTVIVGSERVRDEHPTARQQDLLAGAERTVRQVARYVRRVPLARTVRRLGRNPTFAPRCTLYLSTYRPEVVRLAHFMNLGFFPEDSEGDGPDLVLLDLPEWQEKDRQILVFPELGVTYALGSDYYGEVKMGFLRMAMWEAKERGMLDLHAGSKVLRARGPDGRLRRYGMLLLGLTATGKTTHTCHTHGLTGEGEGIEIAQDDIVFLRDDWSALGTEQGFFLKTEGVSEAHQPLIHRGLRGADVVFENVLVDHGGAVDLEDVTLTGNGRAIVQREALGEAVGPVNLPPASDLDGVLLAFITRRNTVMPIAARLTHEQAAACFMLGESVESTGGDPRRAGMSVRQVGTNPFIVGDRAEEGNRFYAFLGKGGDRVQAYLLNTGGVGEIAHVKNGVRVVERKVLRIAIPEMAALIGGIARGTVEWGPSPYWDLEVPVRVEGVDMGKFDPARFYEKEEIREMVEALRAERRAWLQNFPGLRPEIAKAAAF